MFLGINTLSVYQHLNIKEISEKMKNKVMSSNQSFV